LALDAELRCSSSVTMNTRGPAWQTTAAAKLPAPVIAHRHGPDGGNGQTLA